MSVKIMVPEMGESVVDARVRRWLKQAGDAVTVGEPLVELETDKVDVEVSASKTGVLASIVHPEGADVKIGDTLGVIDEVLMSGGPEVLGSKGVFATPSARKEARERDVPLAAVKATGPRVTKADVVKTAEPAGPAGPAGPVRPAWARNQGADVQAARDHREAARRGASHRGDADDVQ